MNTISCVEEETSYPSDCSSYSRQGMDRHLAHDRQHVKRKTKSERDKRSSRVSTIEEGSSSETWSSLEQTRDRYRRRAGSKRVEQDCENAVEDKNPRYRRRADSKTTGQRVKSFDENTVADSTIQENIGASTCTLKMDNKDIYYGTWNPKEREVLDKVLDNIGPVEQKLRIDEQSAKHEMKHKRQEKKKSLFERLKKAFKVGEKGGGGESDMFPTIEEDPLQDYILTHQKKKKSIFRRLVSHKKKEVDVPRRRAHSTNDSSHFSARVDAMNARANLNKKRSGSTHSLKSLFARSRSVDNLNGAFDYFANQKQIFQRTPSITKIPSKSRNSSIENLHVEKKGGQCLLNHGFEPVRPSVKDICYDNQGGKLIFAQTKIVEARTASQGSVYQAISRQSSIEQEFPPRYCESPSSDTNRYINGYFSDIGPASATPTLNKGKNDSYMSYSAMTSCPSSCPPIRKAFRPPPYDHPSHRRLIQQFDIEPNRHLTSFTKDGWHSGSATPTCVSGYNSDNDAGNIPSEQLSIIPYHARRAIQRSLSKNSSASTYSSNYGYLSESSFCEDDEVFAVSSPISLSPVKEKGFVRRELARTSIKHGVLSTVL